MTLRWQYVLVAALGISFVGCADDLTEKNLIIRPRAIALRVGVQADAMRTNPLPTEEADVTVVMAEPSAKPIYQWRFIACVPSDSVNLVPTCASTDLVPCTGCESAATTQQDPLFSLTIPSASELGDADEVLLLGSVCADGPPATIEQLLEVAAGESKTATPCADSQNVGEFLATGIPVDRDGQANHHPLISDVLLNGGAWEDQASPTDADEGCASTAIRQVGAGAPSFAIEALMQSGSREVFNEEQPDGSTESVTENLLVSWHSTGGKLERSFSFIEDEGDMSGSVLWEPPLVASPEGTLVRFYVVVRDQGTRKSRGGVDVVQRALCVVGNGA